METQPDTVEQPPLVAMLRAARATYGKAIRRSLFESGFDDIPGNGIFVIAAIARKGAPLGNIIRDLGVSKQAAGQLIDTLVLRGYLDRITDPDDRRRLTITLTDRGRAAAVLTRTAVTRVETELLKQVSEEAIGHTRTVLAALTAIDLFPDTSKAEDKDKAAA